jgi:hypothetical protein
VPTVVISPWVARNSVIHAPTGEQAPTPTSQWDATSIIATTNKLLGVPGSLTARDAWAGVFTNVLSEPVPRRDCPATLPPARLPDAAALAREAATPLNDHHFDSLNLLCHLSRQAHAVCARHGRRGAQAALLAQLTAEGAQPQDAAQPWALATSYPHLLADAARRLQQRHFGDISAAMWRAYKDEAMRS